MRTILVHGMNSTTLLDVLDSEIAMKEVWELQTTIAVGVRVPGLQHHYQQAHFQQLLFIQHLLLVLLLIKKESKEQRMGHKDLDIIEVQVGDKCRTKITTSLGLHVFCKYI